MQSKFDIHASHIVNIKTKIAWLTELDGGEGIRLDRNRVKIHF